MGRQREIMPHFLSGTSQFKDWKMSKKQHRCLYRCTHSHQDTYTLMYAYIHPHIQIVQMQSQPMLCPPRDLQSTKESPGERATSRWTFTKTGPSPQAPTVSRHATTVLTYFFKEKDWVPTLDQVIPSWLEAEHHAYPFNGQANRSEMLKQFALSLTVCVCVCVCGAVCVWCCVWCCLCVCVRVVLCVGAESGVSRKACLLVLKPQGVILSLCHTISSSAVLASWALKLQIHNPLALKHVPRGRQKRCKCTYQNEPGTSEANWVSSSASWWDAVWSPWDSCLLWWLPPQLPLQPPAPLRHPPQNTPALWRLIWAMMSWGQVALLPRSTQNTLVPLKDKSQLYLSLANNSLCERRGDALLRGCRNNSFGPPICSPDTSASHWRDAEWGVQGYLMSL